MKPKIRILHQYHNNMFDTVRALERDYDVEFLSYRTSQLAPGVRNRQPKVRRLIWPLYEPHHLNQLLGTDTDILILKHLNDPINLVPYVVAWLKGIQIVIFTQRIRHKHFPGYRVLWWWLGWALRGMGALIVATTQDSYRELTAPFKHIAYIPACINPRRWHSANSRTPKLDQFFILTVAKYQPRKNIPVVIAAVARLAQQYPKIDWQLTVVGDRTPREESQQAWRRVQEVIKETGLQRHVTLLQNVAYQAMARHYAASDVFVLAAASEPLGYAVVEAMAVGKPVVCSDETGAASYIEPDRNGYIGQTGSVEALIEGLAKFITADGWLDTVKVERFGKHSRYLIEQNHAPGVFLNSFRALVLSPAGSSPAASGSSKLK